MLVLPLLTAAALHQLCCCMSTRRYPQSDGPSGRVTRPGIATGCFGCTAKAEDTAGLILVISCWHANTQAYSSNPQLYLSTSSESWTKTADAGEMKCCSKGANFQLQDDQAQGIYCITQMVLCKSIWLLSSLHSENPYHYVIYWSFVNYSIILPISISRESNVIGPSMGSSKHQQYLNVPPVLLLSSPW